MSDAFDDRFFKVLHEVAARHLPPADPCLSALDGALNADDPEARLAAREALNALEATVRDQILMETHRTLAMDAASILAQWTAPAGSRH
ncbi:hypothetical protein HDIA_3878 [Hartmannibacter diazotrophicus]|uniref:Uncharacterized protein n=1 Tax=Hartmannibacter diazotrophicus TaxID=1482074 RepID=A0A2C9DB67_9HYPH|nr:hypothetical protein [Hartmannibacter diazotrophicus]SON57419.1 hypothetical protein HDIA_3878 [Hartmannibacter diazotrophicus]